MRPRGTAQNNQLVAAYATRVVSLSYGVQSSFVIDGVEFRFWLRQDSESGNNLLEVTTNARKPEELVVIIRGLNPCKDTGFLPGGFFVRRLPPQMYRLTTRLAVRDPNRRRRKYLQDMRLREAAQVD